MSKESPMDSATFERQLAADGYTEIETKTVTPRPANGDHAHHFAARGLVLEGAFTVAVEGVPRCYRAGEVFQVAEGTIHHEMVGPEGARVTTGRKY